MKVDELRKLLKETNNDYIKEAFVEVYKSLPKSKKEEIDQTLINLLQGKKEKKTKKEEIIDFKEYLSEINYFIECVYNHYYISPNRVISKQEHSKWRFKVKNYIKTLMNVKIDDLHYNSSNEALIQIYGMLSYGCSYSIFSTDDPFASVGISQCDLYWDILQRVKHGTMNEELIKKMVMHATTPHLSRVTFSLQLIYMVLSLAENENDEKYLVNLSKSIISELKSKFTSKSSSYNFLLKEHLRHVNQLIFILKIDKLNIDDYNYYYDHAYEHDNEVALFIGLELFNEEANEDWIKFYEYSCKKYNIDPRKQLKEEYKKRKEAI